MFTSERSGNDNVRGFAQMSSTPMQHFFTADAVPLNQFAFITLTLTVIKGNPRLTLNFYQVQTFQYAKNTHEKSKNKGVNIQNKKMSGCFL